MKKFNKIMSLALVLILCISLAVPAFASTSDGVRILQDNETVRIAQSESDGLRFISTYNKLENTVTLETFDIASGEILSSTVTDMNSHTTVSDKGVIVNSPTSLFSIATGSKSTNSGFSYNYTSNYCHISRPQKIQNSSVSGTVYSLTTIDRPSNHDSLLSYRDAVNMIAKDEGDIIAVTGAKAFSDAVASAFLIAGTITPTAFTEAIAAFFVSIGLTVQISSITNQLAVDMDRALVHYHDIQVDYENHL